MKHSDAKILFEEVIAVERKHKRFYTEAEIKFLNMLKEPIKNGDNLGTKTGKELERIYRKSQGG